MKRNYILVGAGGTGSALFPFLIRYLETFHRNRPEGFRITIIDGKEVSASKLERQIFFGRFAGSNKATALLEQYGSDRDTVIAIPSYLDSKNIRGIKDNDVVLIAADNFPVRARIERRARKLENVTIINGGNEMIDGSLQIYARRNGVDITPPMSQGHPELLQDDHRDPAALSCDQIAELPGGEQTLIANMMSATAMLNALRKVHQWETDPFIHAVDHDPEHDPTAPKIPEEVFFNMDQFAMTPAPRPAAE